jgi:8-oxo-dGTP pyrophosphatase MutT (NUDIX family)
MAEPEKFLIVNDEDIPLIVVKTKEELHDGPDGLPYKHRSVHVLVEVFGGKCIIQKKAPGTENAGKWSSAASGHVRADESYELAAMRELQEEIGLDAQLIDLFEITNFRPCKENGNEFMKVFGYLMDPTIEGIKINREEVSAVAIIKMGPLIVDIHKNPDKYSKPFIMAMDKLIEMGGGV